MVLPLRFFETTPLGSILNRFSSDCNTIDQVLTMPSFPGDPGSFSSQMLASTQIIGQGPVWGSSLPEWGAQCSALTDTALGSGVFPESFIRLKPLWLPWFLNIRMNSAYLPY